MMEFIVVKRWLVVQRRCKCVILAPLHVHTSGNGAISERRSDLADRRRKARQVTLIPAVLNN